MAVDTAEDLTALALEMDESDSNADLAFTIKKFVFQGLLEKAASVLPSRDVMPVLKNFQIIVTDDDITVAATDMELTVVTVSQSVLTKRAGKAVFPGRKLLDIVHEGEEGDLVLDVKDGVANIAVGPTVWNIKLMDDSEYPDLPDVEALEFHATDRSKFLAALASVRYAAASETTRANLMMIDFSKGRVRAADGVRYQQVAVDFPLEIQIPILSVDDLIKLLKSTDEQKILVGEDPNFLAFKINADVFVANKLNAVFPDMDEILLKPALANDKDLYVDRLELQYAVKRVRINADPETSAVILALAPGKLTVKAKDKLGNDSAETIDVKWDHAYKEVAFNHVHLLQMLEMAEVKSCHFMLGEDTKQRRQPILLTDSTSGTIGVLGQIRIDFVS